MIYSVTTIPDIPIQTKHELKKGSRVFIDGHAHILGKNFASGGEADLFFIDGNYVDVVKIYKSQKLTERKKAKIDKLLAIDIADEHICSPISKVTDQDGEFIGFTMKKSGSSKSGRTLKQRLLSFDSDGFAEWTRRDIVQMTVTILNLLFKLYSISYHQILIGDINLDNFIVHSPFDIYLVDVDSIQIDEFPCPVGQDNFVPAELQGVQFSNILRKPEHERFSIACLLFLCLFNNKNPFACIDGETPAQNIKAGNFPYLSDGTVTDSVPPGNWQYYWSFLPNYIREAFCNSFSSDSSKRTNISKWKELLEKYLSEFDNFYAQDKMANDVVQTRYPLWMRKYLTRCPGCGEYFPAKQISVHSHVCKTCDMKAVKVKEVSCTNCGKSMFLLPNQVKKRNSEELKYCDECLKEVVAECEICGSKWFVKKYESDKHVCISCQKEINNLKEKCIKLLAEYNESNFIKIDFDSRESRCQELKVLFSEIKKYSSHFKDEFETISNIFKYTNFERKAFEKIQAKLLSDEENKNYTNNNLVYWKQVYQQLNDSECEIDGQIFSYTTLPLFNSCREAVIQHIKEIREYIDEEVAKAKSSFNNCVNSLFKGDSSKFVKMKIDEQIEKEKAILQKASKIIDDASIYEADWSTEKQEIGRLFALIGSESDIFAKIRDHLIDANTSTNKENLASWKSFSDQLENGSISVENENIIYKAFPMYNSCFLAVQNYIKSCEEYIKQCEIERMLMKDEIMSNICDWGKSFLCALGVFIAGGLLLWFLTWDGVMKLLLSIVGVAIICLVAFVVNDLLCNDGYGFLIGVIIAAIVGIILVWKSDIGLGVADYFIDHFRLYLYIDIAISSISLVVFKLSLFN